MKTCPNCSTESYNEESICRNCGQPLAVSAPAAPAPIRPPLSKTNKLILVLFGTLGVLIVALLLSFSTSPRTTAPAQPQSAAPIKTISTDTVTETSQPYAKLAAIEAVSPNPPPALLADFKTTTASLARKCYQDTPERIADLIVKSQEILKENGVALKLSDVARHVDRSIPADTQIAKCSDVFATFVVLTTKK
jgi:hypothetical protein